MRTVLLPIHLFVALTCIANSALLSEIDLKNLLTGIRENRITQADFQEQRVIRLMKNANGARVWLIFEAPRSAPAATEMR